jgi:hypothetical protein
MDTQENTVAVVQGFDISNLTSDNVQDVTFRVGVVKNEEGDDISGFIIVGKNSTRYQEIQHEIRVSNLAVSSKRKTNVDASTPEGAELLVSKMEVNENKIALAVVVGYFGFLSNGNEIVFDEDTVQLMFEKKPQWQQQVLVALEKDVNFMKG